MAPTRRNKEGLLARVNFPLYSLQMLTSRHVIVAGGGGLSKTGVANGFEIFELSHNGDRFIAEEVLRHETGGSVVMNCATFNNGKHTYLVAGQESHCQLYNVRLKVVDTSKEGEKIEEISEHQNNVRHRKNSEKETIDTTNTKKKTDNNSKTNEQFSKKLLFKIVPGDSIQTDFSSEEALQRVTRISRSGKFMATGGTDGHLRIWQFPALTKRIDIKAHSKEIDDIDISPNEKWLVSVAKDGVSSIWGTTSGKLIRALRWDGTEGPVKYLHKRCRFAFGEGTSAVASPRLFMLANPVSRVGKLISYLQLWDPTEGSLKKNCSFSESVCALAVSSDGRFVAVGTMFSGSVSIHIAFSLQRVVHVPGAHSMFVTGIEFLPSSKLDGPPVTSRAEAAVLSISVDNRICIHTLPYRSTLPAWVAILLIIVTLFLTFLACSFLGL